MATKEEIAQNEQFLLLSPCFQVYSIIVLSFKGISVLLLQNCHMWARVKPYPLTMSRHSQMVTYLIIADDVWKMLRTSILNIPQFLNWYQNIPDVEFSPCIFSKQKKIKSAKWPRTLKESSMWFLTLSNIQNLKPRTFIIISARIGNISITNSLIIE